MNDGNKIYCPLNSLNSCPLNLLNLVNFPSNPKPFDVSLFERENIPFPDGNYLAAKDNTMHILILEDAKSTQLLLKARLEKEGHTVEAVDNGHQGFLLASSNPYDCIISDIMMPRWDGMKFIEAIQVVRPHLPIIIVSSHHGDAEIRSRLESYRNVINILPKPFDFKELFHTLSKVPIQSHDSVNKMARIVCTIGPASSSTETLGKMLLAGMDVARLNFSHGTHEDHAKNLAAIREAEQTWEKPIAVLQDLCGPKIRVGEMADGAIKLVTGSKIRIQAAPVVGNKDCISTISPEIIADLKIGAPVLLDDGLLELRVLEEGEEAVICEVMSGGLLKSSKGMNLPASSLSLPSITEKDWQDLNWTLNHDIDYVALSFVRSADEVQAIKDHIAKAGKKIRVVAKVEKPEAVNHIREIIETSDAIMIARGDMGVELPAARVPRIQQKIINLCWEMNTPVITATQMLDSMTTNMRPTRAEVTDVSLAIREGTDAVMLSQETATGISPINVVRTMASIICEEERHSKLSLDKYHQLVGDTSANPALKAVASINNMTATLLLDPEGTLYPALSKWNRKVLSLLVTRSMQTARHASLFHNIVPLIVQEKLHRSEIIFKALEMAKESGYIRAGDTVAVVEGEHTTNQGIHQAGALQIVHVT